MSYSGLPIPGSSTDAEVAYDKAHAAGRRHYWSHREERIAAAKAWNDANPERKASNQLAWQRANRDKVSVNNRNRKAAVRGAQGPGLSAQEWSDLQEYYGNCCAYCLEKSDQLTQDHMIPIARGGAHTADNIVPACKTCNSTKRHKTPLEFLAYTLR